MTNKQKLFADKYVLLNRHGTKAALAAGYSKATAGIQAAQLMANKDVKEYINKQLSAIYKRNHATIDETLSILSDIGRVTKKDLLDEHGDFIPIHLLPDRVAHAIEEVEYTTVYVWDPMLETKVPKQVIKKIKLGGKQAALDKVLKVIGGYKLDNEQKKPDPIMLTINPLSGNQPPTIDIEHEDLSM